MSLKSRFIEKYVKKLPFGLLGLLTLFGGAVYIFSNLTYDIFWQQEEKTDHDIFKFLSGYVSHNLTRFMRGVTYLASAQVLQVGYAALIIFYLIPKNYKRAIEIFVVGASGLAITYLLK